MRAAAARVGSDFRLARLHRLALHPLQSRRARLAQLRTDLEAASSDYLRLQELTAKMDALIAEHDGAVERWVYLNELAEKEDERKP